MGKLAKIESGSVGGHTRSSLDMVELKLDFADLVILTSMSISLKSERRLCPIAVVASLKESCCAPYITCSPFKKRGMS